LRYDVRVELENIEIDDDAILPLGLGSIVSVGVPGVRVRSTEARWLAALFLGLANGCIRTLLGAPTMALLGIVGCELFALSARQGVI
jgi:hypothetical protein